MNSFDATCEPACEGAVNEAYFGSNRLLTVGRISTCRPITTCRASSMRQRTRCWSFATRASPLRAPAKAGSLGAYCSVGVFHDSSTKTIYLSQKWSSPTPSEMSILVHETSEKLDAFELRVLRFARETVRYA